VGLSDDRRRRAIAIAGTVLVVALVVAELLPDARGGPRGPASSSFATAAPGVAGWARLLDRAGHPVSRLRRPPGSARLDRRATLVILDAPAPDARAVARFVRAGGRLVVGGAHAGEVAGAVLGDPPQWAPGGAAAWHVAGAAPENARIATVLGERAGRFSSAGEALPLMASARGVQAVVARAGRGRIVALADVGPLRNRLLARADDAGFALAVAGEPGRPVVFEESVHGFGEARGLAAVPARWKVALGGAALALLLGLLAHGRRLGPPEARARELPPPRAAYVDALAIALARTGDRPGAAAPVRAAARDRVLERAGLDGGAPPDAVAAAARRLGLAEDEALAVAGERDDDLLAAGRALARLNGGGR
jgi:Domain of unknown function (DUF4350)